MLFRANSPINQEDEIKQTRANRIEELYQTCQTTLAAAEGDYTRCKQSFTELAQAWEEVEEKLSDKDKDELSPKVAELLRNYVDSGLRDLPDFTDLEAAVEELSLHANKFRKR
jgi:hypothetical protein